MNIGEKNEYDIIYLLNNKKYASLSEKWKNHLKIIFPFIEEDDIIYAYKSRDKLCKTDIIIKCRHTTANISIKTGHNPSMHQEFYFSFFSFLKSLNIPISIIKIISFYHFGMSNKVSNNGKPYSKDEILEKYSKEIQIANEYLQKKEIVEAIIYRTIIKGSKEEYAPIDYLYYGNTKQGVLLSVEDIYKLILKENKDAKGPIHFKGLLYQPAGRALNRVDRNYCRIKWPILTIMFYNPNILKE